MRLRHARRTATRSDQASPFDTRRRRVRSPQMLTTIAQFRTRVATDPDALISDLQSLTGRYGEDEAKAWNRSLAEMSRIFQHDSFKPLHVYFGSRGLSTPRRVVVV